ncbi:MAG: histidine phosphatase family protein [Firmicutes bacterium]|nr:histidine phosphatase family protein [Bacillota bacterium]
MKLIWLRHGETNPNRERRYCGHLDPPLNEKGRCQAEAAASRLAVEPVVQVVASDLLRARQTAAPLLRQLSTATMQVTPLLRELSFGEWEGWTYEEIHWRNPQALHRWLSDPVHLSPPGGETMTQLGSRLDRWLNEVLRQHAGTGSRVIAVTHGGPLRWFISRYLKQDPASFWERSIPHGGMLSVKWDRNRWREHPLEDWSEGS